MLRKRRTTTEVDFEGVDLDRYDFPGLRADVLDILDIQGAILRVLRWALLVPIVGSFTYLGWFDEADAKAHGARLKEEGLTRIPTFDVRHRGRYGRSTNHSTDPERLSAMQP